MAAIVAWMSGNQEKDMNNANKKACNLFLISMIIVIIYFCTCAFMWRDFFKESHSITAKISPKDITYISETYQLNLTGDDKIIFWEKQYTYDYSSYVLCIGTRDTDVFQKNNFELIKNHMVILNSLEEKNDKIVPCILYHKRKVYIITNDLRDEKPNQDINFEKLYSNKIAKAFDDFVSEYLS